MRSFLALCLMIGSGTPSIAQGALSPILFIYDASGSMWGQLDGRSKKEIASDVLASSVSALPEGQHIGLMAYGHRRKGDCDDIEFLLDLENVSKSEITSAVSKMNALGKTPLARSASMALNSLEEANTKATVILITDGIESCDGDICDVVAKAKLDGIDFKLHIVGFGLEEGETAQLECAANAGGGKYYDAADANGLQEGLSEATAITIDEPANNFSVYASKNGEPVDAWIHVTPMGSKKVMDGSRTYRDTGWVHLPSGSYNVRVTPLEGTDIPGTGFPIHMKENEPQHRDVSFDGGSAEVSSTNNGEGWDSMVKLYDMSTGDQVASTRTYGRSKTMEVPAGYYKVTFQALVIKGPDTYFEMDSVMIEPNMTIPISHNFDSGTALIGVRTANGELIDATVNFHDATTGERIDGARTYTSPNNNPRSFLLDPGTYQVKIVTLGEHQGHSKTIEVTVVTGETTTRTLTF
ncbi:MAG: VWA domain-containing protein [Flavobacteriales bacterium]|nr:VWA domain-containing protein [Flavobacteriales bacterium]